MSLEEIESKIKEYFDLESGIFIDDHLNVIDLIEDIFVTKRSLKHIVEQRKKDSYTKEKSVNLFLDLHNIINQGFYILVPNKNNSKLLIENNTDKKTLLVAIVELHEGKKIIRTAFYRSTRKLKKYFKNKKS